MIRLLEEHPAQHFRAQERVFGDEAGALGQVEQDGPGFDQGAAVLEFQRRHAREAALLAEGRLGGFALGEIERHALERKLELVQEDADFPAVAGVAAVVEAQHVGVSQEARRRPATDDPVSGPMLTRPLPPSRRGSGASATVLCMPWRASLVYGQVRSAWRTSSSATCFSTPWTLTRTSAVNMNRPSTGSRPKATLTRTTRSWMGISSRLASRLRPHGSRPHSRRRTVAPGWCRRRGRPFRRKPERTGRDCRHRSALAGGAAVFASPPLTLTAVVYSGRKSGPWNLSSSSTGGGSSGGHDIQRGAFGSANHASKSSLPRRGLSPGTSVSSLSSAPK